MSTNFTEEDKQVFKTVRKRQNNSIIETRFNKLGKVIDKIVTTNNINNKSIANQNKNNFPKKNGEQKIRRKSITIKRNGDLEISTFETLEKNTKVNNFYKKKKSITRKYNGPVIMRKSITNKKNNTNIFQSENPKKTNRIVSSQNFNNFARKSITIRTSRPNNFARKSYNIRSARNTDFKKSARKSTIIRSSRNTNYNNFARKSITIRSSRINDFNDFARKSITVKNSRNAPFDELVRKSVVLKKSNNSKNYRDNFETDLRKSVVVKKIYDPVGEKSAVLSHGNSYLDSEIRKSVVLKNNRENGFGAEIDNYRTQFDGDREIVSVTRRVSNIRGANQIRKRVIKAKNTMK